MAWRSSRWLAHPAAFTGTGSLIVVGAALIFQTALGWVLIAAGAVWFVLSVAFYRPPPPSGRATRTYVNVDPLRSPPTITISGPGYQNIVVMGAGDDLPPPPPPPEVD